MSLVEGFGSVTWWGFSPSLDLLAAASKAQANNNGRPNNTTTSSDCVDVLLVGVADLRHFLSTLCSCETHTSKPLHFYVIEANLEVYARHMLFLTLLTEPSTKLGLQEKVELFLELFGNSLVRAQTVEHLQATANELIRMVTDLDFLSKRLPILHIEGMKFKERDMLEGIFKFWRLRDDDSRTFDMAKHWDHRLRHYLGARYDSRSGVFDWDYHMKLQELAPVIHAHEYSAWREGGVAYRLRDDAPYEHSNRTLASGVVVSKAGEKVPVRGYWGDIVNSPFLCFGVESVECGVEEVMVERVKKKKKKNEVHVKMSQEISEHNLLSLTHTLTTGQPYTPSQHTPSQPPSLHPHDRGNGLGTIEEISEEEGGREGEEGEGEGRGEGEEEGGREGEGGEGKVEKESVTSPGDHSVTSHMTGHVMPGGSSDDGGGGPLLNGKCRVTFLPLNSAAEIGKKKAKYRNSFHVAYFSNSMVHHLKEEMASCFAGDCTLILETAKFMLDLKKEDKEEYVRKVTAMAHAIGFKTPSHSTSGNDSPVHLIFSR